MTLPVVSPLRQKGLRESQPSHRLWESPADTALQNNWTLRPNTHLPYRQALNICTNIYRQFQSNFKLLVLFWHQSLYTPQKNWVLLGKPFCAQTYFFDILTSKNEKKNSIPAVFLSKVS